MLSVHMMERHFRAGRLGILLEAVMDNGIIMPMALQVRLANQPVCALALGLKRLAELAYGPSAFSRALVAEILAQQQEDGSWAGDPLSTAVSLHALRQAQPIVGPATDAVELALERGLAALALMQQEDGLFFASDDRTEEMRALTGACVLQLLVSDPSFCSTIRFADLMNYFEQHILDTDTQMLLRLARLEEPVRQTGFLAPRVAVAA
jgi:hypothetical protein